MGELNDKWRMPFISSTFRWCNWNLKTQDSQVWCCWHLTLFTHTHTTSHHIHTYNRQFNNYLQEKQQWNCFVFLTIKRVILLSEKYLTRTRHWEMSNSPSTLTQCVSDSTQWKSLWEKIPFSQIKPQKAELVKPDFMLPSKALGQHALPRFQFFKVCHGIKSFLNWKI